MGFEPGVVVNVTVALQSISGSPGFSLTLIPMDFVCGKSSSWH
jgi:hypothetical protein